MSVRSAELDPFGVEIIKEVRLRTEEVKGDESAVLSLKERSGPLLSSLMDTELVISFKEAQEMDRLAIPRIGYKDWAVPARVRVSIDGKNLGAFDLKAEASSPMEALGSVDILHLGEAMFVEEIRLVVESVDSVSNNQHGMLKVFGAKAAYAQVDLEEFGPVPLNSRGIEFELQTPVDVVAPKLRVRAYQFRRQRTAEIVLQNLEAGRNLVTVNWDSIRWDGRLPSAIEPYNFNQFVIEDVTGGADVELLGCKYLLTEDATMTVPWDTIPRRVYTVDQEGWQDGIPTEGFGRFGWLPNNGLLTGSFNGRGFSNQIIDPQGEKSSYVWSIQCGDATYLDWERTRSDWVSISHMAYYDYTSEVKDDLAAKAPQLIKERRVPQTVQGSILAPGFLIDSEDTKLAIRLDEGERGEGYLAYPSTSGIVVTPLGDASISPEMSEGWFVVGWAGAEQSPVLFAPQEKVDSLLLRDGELEVIFEQAMGRVGVAFPGGFRPISLDETSQVEGNVALVRDLASILRAYPIGCSQRFRDSGGYVEIEEKFQYLGWENVWGESGLEIAPVSPLLSFADGQNYPVELDDDLLKLNWPTKYGPYAYMPGGQVSYRLSIPPMETSMYLAPEDSSKRKFPSLGAEISKLVAGDANRLKFRDNLQAWWMWAPSSLAFPLLDASQKSNFLETWRSRLDSGLAPHTWYIRKEPYSASTYPVAFGWVEEQTMTIGDVNSGVGATLYALWAYARCSGDWEYVRSKWPVVQATVENFLLEHDWCLMASGAREHSASSAIDMDGIAYEGVLAYAQMAEKLGFEEEASYARFLVARFAVTTCIRWVGLDWRNPAQSRDDWEDIGVGFGEFPGVDYHTIKHGDPDKIVSEIALSLSWVGQYPELYDLHRWGLGDDFWEWFEWEMVESRMVDWRKDHPGSRNNHPANIAAHLYFRYLLGATKEDIIAELESQEGAWAMAPQNAIAQENAALYAMLEGRQYPLVLRDWGRARIVSAEFSDDRNLASLVFKSEQDFLLKAKVGAAVSSVMLDGKTVDFVVRNRQLEIPIPVGESRVNVHF
ncbi:hypothetical protein QEH59_17180 [Coraliomargarita sp. SDUM461004]|uniref:Uncharacterized protein n=2 Tax=Thalassobacterium sedimentorum TaxID=3041258 RepID=A0ABU1AN01_9BACT|nr:hypothetical protein [Coraliomargarita sp. SDUM461004]